MENPFRIHALVLAALSLALPARSEEPSRHVTTAPIPGWVEVADVATPTTVPTDELSDGVYFLATEDQVNVGEEAEYSRSVELVATAEGTGVSSEISVNFDPAFQTVEFHRIRIHRDGEVFDRLDLDRIRVLEREEDLEHRMLDGSLTALCVLEDVRVGDIVEYAYTIRGWNPAFGKRYYDSFDVGWSVPVGRQLLRVLSPADRPIAYRVEATGEKPETIRRDDGLVEIRWERRDPKPIHDGDSDVPDFYTVYPWIEFSETSDWRSVARWAAGLYAGDFPLPPELEARVAAIKEAETPTKRKIGDLLQLVQEDVRYLGVEMGTGAYHPRPPELVYRRRFGDCKDKTLLLRTLLARIGVKSTPALVNTSYCRSIGNWLPSPAAFDHVILAVDYGGERYWLDPTRTGQRGPLESRGVSDYGLALLADPEADSLTKIALRDAARSTVKVSERFEIPGVSEPAELTVRTTYSGTAAESARGYFANNGRESIGKESAEFYAKDYPDIELLHPVSFEYFPDENRCETTEVYRIEKLWERDGGAWRANIYPRFIANELDAPSSSRRKTPFAIQYPRKVTHDLELRLWEDWGDTDSATEVTTDAFRFKKTSGTDRNVVRIHHEYGSLADHVPPADIADYRAKIEAIQDRLNWEFTHGAEVAAEAKPEFEIAVPTVALALTTTLLAVGFGIGLARIPRKQPPLAIPEGLQRYQGIGGWLILPQLGLWLTPIFAFLSLIPIAEWAFDTNEWTAMRSVVHDGQFPVLHALVFGQMIALIVVLVMALFLLGFFYRRRFFTPALLIGFFVVGALSAAFDYGLVSVRTDVGADAVRESMGVLTRETLKVFVWVLYFLVSRRVKATFRF